MVAWRRALPAGSRRPFISSRQRFRLSLLFSLFEISIFRLGVSSRLKLSLRSPHVAFSATWTLCSTSFSVIFFRLFLFHRVRMERPTVLEETAAMTVSLWLRIAWNSPYQRAESVITIYIYELGVAFSQEVESQRELHFRDVTAHFRDLTAHFRGFTAH